MRILSRGAARAGCPYAWMEEKTIFNKGLQMVLGDLESRFSFAGLFLRRCVSPRAGLSMTDRISGMVDYGNGRGALREGADAFEICHLDGDVLDIFFKNVPLVAMSSPQPFANSIC